MTETISTAAVPTTDLEEQVKRRIEQVVSNDPQLAALLPEDSVTEAVNEPDLPLVEVIRRLLEGYGDRPALGQRAFEFVTGDDGATVIALKPEYTTVSYRELWERAEAIAAAWHEQGIRDGDFVAQLGFTSTDFASLDVAGLRLGTVSVPLQTGASLQQVAKDAELQSYEIPRDFIVETVPFTVESGLLSDARKLLRPKLKDHYGERLEALYAELAESQNERLRQLAREAATRPVLETVTDAAAALLGASSSDLAPDVRFIDLGGDSLSALSYSELLRDIFEVDVPVGVINSVANDLAAIARHIEAQRTGAATQPTFASVHGKDATVITAGELTLDKFLDESLLKAAKDVQPATADVKTVLVTGGNGWLGRWLVLDWLERLAPNGGKVYALIRGADAEAARARLDAVYESGDPKLSAHYRQLAQQSLEVIAGDFGDQDLGLSQEVWQKLAKDVDLIVHSGALVNHVLPYSQLFGPNVAGTAEIIKLAISERLKPVTYLSTVGIADQIPVTEFEEDSDVRVMSAERQINDGYANGYGNSKWAGEVLLREAHDLAGLPVRVFRSDMILAHSDYHGQLNVTDVFTRSIQSLLLTGVAPASFYELDADGNRQRAHYDGVPGDFTAASITAIGGVNVVDGYRSFDVFNPHHDGVSMDTFVDWLIDAGYKIARIDDYDQWLARFELALKGLPEQQRQQSVLPLLKMYEKPQPAIDGSALPTAEFSRAVHEAKVGDSGEIPHVTKELILKYASDIQLLGLV